jgi:SAM-dependent methyltransferase
VEWLRQGRPDHYLGLDFSESLLAEADAAVAAFNAAVAALGALGSASFARADLSDPDWTAAALHLAPFRGALAFAVLHHLPTLDLRLSVLRAVHALLAPGGLFIHSEWQFQHSPKLMARRVPWSQVGLDEADLEPGDTLLDWRYALPGQAEQSGLRYVHLFTREELDALASAAGFRVSETFESDGAGGRLGLYQVWERIG